MKPNELSELFNLSERRKYNIVNRWVDAVLRTEADIIEYCREGAIVLATDDYDNIDKFPTVDVAVLCGYKIENGHRKLIVRKLTDLSTSVTVEHAVPLRNTFKPVVLNVARDKTPFTCRVIGYLFTDNILTVNVVGCESSGNNYYPLEDFQTIKKDSE